MKLRILITIYILFHFTYDWWGLNTVGWDVTYHIAHYMFVSLLCLLASNFKNSFDYFLVGCSSLFFCFSVLELSLINQTRYTYDLISVRSYDVRTFSIIVSWILIIFFIKKWLK